MPWGFFAGHDANGSTVPRRFTPGLRGASEGSSMGPWERTAQADLERTHAAYQSPKPPML